MKTGSTRSEKQLLGNFVPRKFMETFLAKALETGSGPERSESARESRGGRRGRTIADDHAGLQGLVGERLVADAAGPFVHVEEAAHAVPRPVQVVQARLPQRRAGKRVQQVAWEGGGRAEVMEGQGGQRSWRAEVMEGRGGQRSWRDRESRGRGAHDVQSSLVVQFLDVLGFFLRRNLFFIWWKIM